MATATASTRKKVTPPPRKTASSRKATAAPATILQDELLPIPLDKLVPSPLNVRKVAGQNIEELAASILAVGLRQNLTVLAQTNEKGKPTGLFEVTAGGRRLRALQLLAKRKQIPADFMVFCKSTTKEQAVATSLTENFHRENMHPADQFDAFKAMIDGGASIEETAASFGVSELVVKQRLKLANVSPKLLTLYRNDELSLEAITAYAVTDDHKLQEKVYEQLGKWRRDNAYNIRKALTETEIESTHPLVKFVGLEDYKAAGGALRQDLFSEEDEGEVFWICDAGLLTRLATEKLEKTAARVRKEGWSWVEIILEAPDWYEMQGQYHELRKVPAKELSEKATQRLQAIDTELETLGKEIDTLLDEDQRQERITLIAKTSKLRAEQEKLKSTALGYTAEQMQHAGCLVTFQQGTAHTIRALVKKSDKAAMKGAQQATRAATDQGGESDSTDAKPKGLSQAMVNRLFAHRSAALQAELAQRPDYAMATITAQLLMQLLGEDRWFERPAKISAELPLLNVHEPNIAESKAAKLLESMREAAARSIPEGVLDDSGALINWLYLQSNEAVMQLLAVCVAHFVTAGGSQPLVDLLQLDMRKWWQADREHFFNLVPKAVAVATVAEACGEDAAREVAPLKKAAAAELAEKKLAGTGWLPAPLRADCTNEE